MNLPQISNDKMIIFFLGAALILLIILNQPEYYSLILAGLLGVAGVNKYNQNRIESTIESSINKYMEEGDDKGATENNTC